VPRPKKEKSRTAPFTRQLGYLFEDPRLSVPVSRQVWLYLVIHLNHTFLQNAKKILKFQSHVNGHYWLVMQSLPSGRIYGRGCSTLGK
jgi:hypothetical protein